MLKTGRIESDFSGIVWPPVPGAWDAQVLALLHQMEATEWWSPDKIRENQLSALRPLLAHFEKTSPFYRKRMQRTGHAPAKIMDWEAFELLPILTRDDIQATGEDLYSVDCPTSHGEIQISLTTGSCGQAVSIRRTQLTDLFLETLSLRNHLWQGRDLEKSLAFIQCFPGGGYSADGYARHPTGAWEPNWATGYDTGPVHLLDCLTCTLDDQIDWLRQINPAYIQSYPTNLTWLALRCEELSLKIPALKEAIAFSECVSPVQRRIVQRIWGVRLSDMYSAGEIGLLATECPDHPGDHYLVPAENVILEVLDDNGRPCGPGEIGRVIVTDLHNYATPLIRYDIGDMAEVATACPAGRGLPCLKRIVGRVRHMLRLRNGTRVMPYPMSKHDLTSLAPIRQIQLAQTSFDRIEVRFTSARPLTVVEERAILEAVDEEIPYTFQLRAVRLEEIPRLSGGKFLEFSCEIED